MRSSPWTAAADGFVARQDERQSAHLLRRFAVREHGPRFWAALWALGAAAVLAALAPAVVDSGPPLRGPDVVFILAAGSFIACGLIAWRRRPDNHSGRLMTATGFAALIHPLLSQLGSPLATTLALLLYSAWTIGYVVLLLTFVTGGRPASKVDWALAGAFTFTLVVLQLAWMVFLEREDNLLLVSADAQTAETIDEGRRWLTALSSLAVAVVLAVRWRAASRARRRALLPGVVGGLSALLFTILLVDGLLAATPSEPLWWLANGALMLVPAAYLAGLLRSRLARGGLAALLLELRTMRGDELQRALGRAAGDPSLEVVDGETTPPRMAGRSIAPIEHEGRRVAALVYDDSLDDDPELVNGVRARSEERV
jgi:hypothetical protein